MVTVGLTGGIATGKSTVAGMLRALGARVIDADRIAHEVTAPGAPAISEIAARFGPGVLDPDGNLDRKALADIVFGDLTARRDLEAITHPLIRQRMAKELAAAESEGQAVVVLDIPLLFESGWDAFLGATILLVYAPESLQRQRLRTDRGLSEAEIDGRVAAQIPIDEKRARATWVIDNSGTLDATRDQVQRWWHEHAEAAAHSR